MLYYQIIIVKFIENVWQTVQRIDDWILRVKELIQMTNDHFIESIARKVVNQSNRPSFWDTIIVNPKETFGRLTKSLD